jgi:hypothetical protein
MLLQENFSLWRNESQWDHPATLKAQAANYTRWLAGGPSGPGGPNPRCVGLMALTDMYTCWGKPRRRKTRKIRRGLIAKRVATDYWDSRVDP